MSARRLYLLVEGNDDERFFSRVVVPLVSPRYRSVHVVRYAGMKRGTVCRLVRALRHRGDDYIVFSDIDEEQSVQAKKEVIRGRFCVLSDRDIVVIVREIESWYLAGLDAGAEDALSLPHARSTDDITKEDFNARIPRRYSSRIAFMHEILDRYSVTVACGKNRSFRYYATRFRIAPCDGAPGAGAG
ncbi:MAG: hypothetical protein QFX32_08995 [Methanolinea sp.]|nr:hypothetical protein [Methanolinea sp.]